ncbi:MAG: aldo/keto reductase [Chloroflexi bacterium]|nr:aldo/keto reductase [Chloroflexota bacterium]
MAHIKKRRLGKTGLMVTELGLGAMDTPQVKEGGETLNLALDLGINFLDTARIYQGSEALIGEVISARGGKSFYIASKTINRTRDGSQYDVDRSLKLLGVDRIDLYQLDDVLPEEWDRLMAEGGAYEGLLIARERGLIDHIGITSHSLEVVEKAIACDAFETVMLEYSAFYRDAEKLIPLARAQDIGVIVMRPLGGSGRTSSLRTRMAAGQASLTPTMLLRYVLSNPDISVAIAGVRYPSRVRENVHLALTYDPLEEAKKREYEREAQQLF